MEPPGSNKKPAFGQSLTQFLASRLPSFGAKGEETQSFSQHAGNRPADGSDVQDLPCLPPSPSSSSLHSVSSTSSTLYSSSQKHSFYPKPTDFQNAVLSTYAAVDPSPTTGTDKPLIWCPVFRIWAPESLMSCLHIIPSELDADTAGYIFGNTTEGMYHKCTPANGLYMAKCVVKAITDGDLAIVRYEPLDKRRKFYRETCAMPRQDSKEGIDEEDGGEEATPPVELRLILMKRCKAGEKLEGLSITYGQLDRTELEFRNDFRPDVKHLYLRYVISKLIWLNIREADELGGVWKPKREEKWLRESLMVEFARRIENWGVWEEYVSGSGMFDEDEDCREMGGDAWVHVVGDAERKTMAGLISRGFLAAPYANELR